MFGHASICHEAIYSTLFGNNGLDYFLHPPLHGYVDLDKTQVLMLPLQSQKVMAGLFNIQRIDDGGRIGQANLGDAQADATVGPSN